MHTSNIIITKEQREEAKRLEIQERKKMAFIEAIIKNEPINLKDHEKGWHSSYMSNMSAGKIEAEYAKPIFEYGEKWARLMQVEMKRTNQTQLTEDIVKRTEDLLGEYAMRSRSLLVSTWAHGKELGRILGWPEHIITGSRKNHSNVVVMRDYQRD